MNGRLLKVEVGSVRFHSYDVVHIKHVHVCISLTWLVLMHISPGRSQLWLPILVCRYLRDRLSQAPPFSSLVTVNKKNSDVMHFQAPLQLH